MTSARTRPALGWPWRGWSERGLYYTEPGPATNSTRWLLYICISLFSLWVGSDSALIRTLLFSRKGQVRRWRRQPWELLKAHCLVAEVGKPSKLPNQQGSPPQPESQTNKPESHPLKSRNRQAGNLCEQPRRRNQAPVEQRPLWRLIGPGAVNQLTSQTMWKKIKKICSWSFQD